MAALEVGWPAAPSVLATAQAPAREQGCKSGGVLEYDARARRRDHRGGNEDHRLGARVELARRACAQGILGARCRSALIGLRGIASRNGT